MDDEEELQVEGDGSEESEGERNILTEDNEDGSPKGTEGDKEEEDGTSDVSYPDTSIDLQYTSGGKFQLQRGTSHSSSQATEDFVDLGDGEILDLRTPGRIDQEENRKQRLSAKQRRQMRKKGASVTKTGDEISENVESGSNEVPGMEPRDSKTEVDAGKPKQPIVQQVVIKRGKKAKLKKIKEKYGDQDEEDRELMMQILGSAGAPKESKGRKKGKDSKGRKGSTQARQGGQGNVKDPKKDRSQEDSTNHVGNRNKPNNVLSEKYQDIQRYTKKTKNSEVSVGETSQENPEMSLENFASVLEESLIQNGVHETDLDSGTFLWFHSDYIVKKNIEI